MTAAAWVTSTSPAELPKGHLGLASRRIRIEAVGGALSIYPAEPHGTVADVSVPLVPTPSDTDVWPRARTGTRGSRRQMIDE